MIARVDRTGFSQGPYLTENIPAVITDCLSDWSEHGKWSPEWLCSRAHERQVKVCVSQNNRFNWRATMERKEVAEFSYEEMTFSAAARRITGSASGSEIYLMQQSLPEKFPELLESIATPQWVTDPNTVKTNLWFGRGSITQLHYDGQNNFFAQLYGDKEFTIFSPADSHLLYAYPVDSLFPHASYVDVDAP